MAEPARKLMTADEFLLWDLEQEDKHELVDGIPVKKYGNDTPEMMANGRRQHAQVISNIHYHLRRRLEGGPCEVFSDVFSVRTSITKQRRPDIIVECARGGPDDLEATEPRVLFEVLSPSSGREDLVIKPEEYKRLPTVGHYVVVDPDVALLKVWNRDADGRWSDEAVVGLDAVLALTALGVELPLAEIYDGMDLIAAR